MALRIAFDLDGVLADMEGELLRQADILFEPDSATEPPAKEQPTASENPPLDSAPEAPPADDAAPDLSPPLRKLNLPPRQQRRLWHHIETIENFWEKLDEHEPGVIARLAVIAKERRWEVIFLTKRPESAGSTAQVQTQRWLQARGFDLPSVFVVQGSRGRIADALGLDFVVDDRPENCFDVAADSTARAILIWREDEQHLPVDVRRLGIGVVTTVGDCLDMLTEIDSPGGPKMMDRVRRLLGLKESTGS